MPHGIGTPTKLVAPTPPLMHCPYLCSMYSTWSTPRSLLSDAKIRNIRLKQEESRHNKKEGMPKIGRDTETVPDEEDSDC